MAQNGSIFLNLIKNISPKKIEDILSSFETPDKIFSVSRADFKNIPSLSDKNIDQILQLRDSDALSRELKLIREEGICVIDFFEENYPSLLKEISHPPLVLYYKGDYTLLNAFLFAMVGSRIPTFYGLALAEEFAYKLSLLGVVITSGLARGIDTAAHKGALKKGKTVAVLGSGLLNVYPRENHALSQQIGQQGVLVSEFPLYEPPLKENFPRRNRIISGLSRGVLVVEAAQRSGALITARLACEQGREVFALPGKAGSPLSKGTHLLIKEGAKLVDSIYDILEEFPIESKEEKSLRPALTPAEKLVFDIIGREGVSWEEISVKSNLERPSLSKTVLELQFKGLIKEVKPSYFIRL